MDALGTPTPSPAKVAPAGGVGGGEPPTVRAAARGKV
jgi:hypothetical protein